LRERRAHALGTMAMHHDGLARVKGARRVEHMSQERPAGDGMQDFWQVRAHALALAGGKHDYVERHWGILAKV
jgi:hypothetical protein